MIVVPKSLGNHRWRIDDVQLLYAGLGRKPSNSDIWRKGFGKLFGVLELFEKGIEDSVLGMNSD